jgi:hypothetical protein
VVRKIIDDVEPTTGLDWAVYKKMCSWVVVGVHPDNDNEKPRKKIAFKRTARLSKKPPINKKTSVK